MIDGIINKLFECAWPISDMEFCHYIQPGVLSQGLLVPEASSLSHTCSQFPFLLIFAACVCFFARKSTLQLYGKEGLYQKALKSWISQHLKPQSWKIPHKPVQTFLNKKFFGKITVSCGPSIYTQMNKTGKICRHKHLQIKLALRDWEMPQWG